jgi:hypothetical protein
MGTDQRVTLDDQGDLTVVGICTTCPPCTHHWWDSVNSRVIHAGTPEARRFLGQREGGSHGNRMG